MLRLFQTIFGKDSVSAPHYPDELITRAVERAVDGTDPRLRALPGYQRRLRPAVIGAIDYVVALVDGMIAPVALTRANYATDPRLPAIFASVEHMREVLAHDPALSGFMRQRGAAAAPSVYALMVMDKQERKVFGMDLRGEVLQREVAQVSVSFANHRLLDPVTDETELRLLLKRRTFDALLALALARITQRKELRAGLKRQRDLLRRKLKLLAAGQWGFEAGVPSASADPAAVEAKLADIEEQLRALRPDTETLAAHLDIVADVLATASAQIRGARVPHVVDRMGIKHVRPARADLAFELGELRASDGSIVYVLPVSVVPKELPPPVDFLAEAERYLH